MRSKVTITADLPTKVVDQQLNMEIEKRTQSLLSVTTNINEIGVIRLRPK